MHRALLGVLLVGGAASAGPTRLVVLDVHAPPMMMGLAAQLTANLLEEAKRQRFRVTPPEDIKARFDEETYEKLKQCGGSPVCVRGFLPRERGRLVLGSLSRDDSNYLLRLWLIDLERGQVIADVDRPILIASRRLQREIDEAVPRLLRGEVEAMGTLVVEADTRGAVVLINGEARGEAPVSARLKPGKHRVRVERSGHLPVDRLVSVEADATTREVIRLLPDPSAVRIDSVLPPVVVAEERANGAGPPGVPAGIWVLGGAALAFGATGGVFGWMSQSSTRALQDGYEPGTDTYRGTRASALTAQRDARIANVAFVAAGAAAAAGALWAVLWRSSEASVTLDPGPDGARASVAGRF